MARVKRELPEEAPTAEETQLVEAIKEAVVPAVVETPEVEKPVTPKEHKKTEVKTKSVTKKKQIVT